MRCGNLVAMKGIEPPTPELSVRYSNH